MENKIINMQAWLYVKRQDYHIETLEHDMQVQKAHIPLKGNVFQADELFNTKGVIDTLYVWRENARKDLHRV